MMKALSLWQPHALAIALGLKPFETREWATGYRGPLAIHASLRKWTDTDPWSVEARRRLDLYVRQHGPVEMVYGAVICTVNVVDDIRTDLLRGRIAPEHEFWGDFSDGERGLGRYAKKLTEVCMLPKPLYTRGFQGFFEVDLEASNKVAAAGTLPLFGEVQ